MSEQEPHNPHIDPSVTSNIEYLRDAPNGVEIDGLIPEGVPAFLTLEGSHGAVVLHKAADSEEKGFLVAVSSDPKVKVGGQILLDGSTVSGGMLKPGVLTPNTRASFRRRVDYPVTIGPENRGNEMVTQEEFESFKKHGLAQVLPDGQAVVSFWDPTPRATDFISHASLTLHPGEGDNEQSTILF